MWQRFSLYDARIIGYYLGILLLFLAVAMAIPCAVGLVFGEWAPASHYLFVLGLTLMMGVGLCFLRVKPATLNRRQAVAVTALAWIVLSLVASVPLYLSGHYAVWLDSLFDAVSGFTTTGASTILDVDHLSNADNAWRFVMHSIGGLGLIVVALSLGLFGKRGSASLYIAEGRSEHVVPNIIQTTQFIVKASLFVIIVSTTLLAIIFIIIGMDPVRAVLHAIWISIAGFVTGGFSPMSQSIMYYHSFAAEVVIMLVMIFGAINFTLYAEIKKGRVAHTFKDIELRTMVIWLCIATCVFAASLGTTTGFSRLPAMLRRGLFMIISAFSNCGFQNITTNQLTSVLTSGAFLTLAILMAVGGGMGSTAGGIKLGRIGVITKYILVSIKETLAPDSARVVIDYNHVGRRILTSEVEKEAMVIFVLYTLTYTVGAFVGVAHGYDALQAIFESMQLTSNSGISAGITTAGMPVTLEIFYILQMLAGRIEFMAFLALIVGIVTSLNPRRWLHKK